MPVENCWNALETSEAAPDAEAPLALLDEVALVWLKPAKKLSMLESDELLADDALEERADDEAAL